MHLLFGKSQIESSDFVLTKCQKTISASVNKTLNRPVSNVVLLPD